MRALTIKGLQCGLPFSGQNRVKPTHIVGQYRQVIFSRQPASHGRIPTTHLFADRGMVCVRMPDLHLDSAHFALTWEDDLETWTVQDLLTVAGTDLDGAHLSEMPQSLTPGTEHVISAGLCRFYVTVSSD